MLNLSTNMSLGVKHVKFPLYFEHKNVCIHCGAKGALVFVDKFGRESTAEVAAFDHMRCRKCNRIYSMKWSPTEKDPNIYRPSAVEFNIKMDFINIVNSSNIKKKGEKVLE